MSDDPLPYDLLGLADAARDERKHMSACPSCGSPEPVRVGTANGRGVCSDCWDGWRRCVLCRRWLDFDAQSISLAYIGPKGIGDLCSYCQDRHLHDEPRHVVTVGPGDWVEGIEDA